jgi:hypothetical protein
MFETIAGIMSGMAVGMVIGLGGYTFLYARGASYLTDNPEPAVEHQPRLPDPSPLA